MATKVSIYREKIRKALMAEFGLKNVMEVPVLEKICINAGIGDASSDAKLIETAAKEIQAITGQKPVLTRAKKAIATFKVRGGQPIGVKVTLRGEKMWNFVENLVNVALPRVRDFKGLPYNSFDNQGNYTLGIKEQIIFTEINFDEVKRVRGFNVTFVMSTNNKDYARSLLKAIGLPIVNK
ncbi:50S ribosomal protein L5 [Candidatus Malacoplasma girerdii]|uniref:Large ribosomal subunit protein uL5 n=1 Tax=Candidatus Malacoplasma girerdii TaxID=1318617 RepID=A0A097SSB0_9BACT|nr:50S ribosomal protein L5 [Candidatus Malacoplasma girerdii]ASJ88992.1 MAG: 50S ribosomal protein L5 [Candidatus Malacoplasma girerdii]